MPVDKSVVVPLGVEETFALLTEPDRLRRWQTITARIDVRAGGDFRWTIVPGHTAAGKIVEVEPGRRLVLSWGWEDTTDLPPGASTLTITLEPADGGTKVHLVHDGLTDAQAASHAEGWSHYLDRLALAARNGDAGPDEWAATPDPMDKLNAAESSLAVCQQVLRGVKDTEGTAPTPCAKFTVNDLIEHLLGSLTHLATMAGGEVPTSKAGNIEARVADIAQPTLEAWRRRGIEGMVPFGGGEMPASMAINILSVEFLVHAWDFAQATSQDVVASEALGEYVLGLAQELISPHLRDGDRFAAAVEIGPDAGAVDRLIAFTGRAS